MSSVADRAIVKKERLCDVVGRDLYRVNNKHGDKYNPFPPRKIVQWAEELVGQEFCYSLISNNCDHFVNELYYGVSCSHQVTDVLMTAGVTAGAIVEVGLAPASLRSCRSKREKQ
ncbi:phospholipase A and acyltransferase 3-like [Bos indicus]|uniref:Phospholipase A and acyltransferase 3-like n=1 Tax=Bos indicus TaxID=9915 RepID=A0ABM4RTP1_BOSIN